MRKKLLAAMMVLLVLALGLCVHAFAEENATNMTKKCGVKFIPEGSKSAITDKSDKTSWQPEGGSGEMRVKLPDGVVYFELSWLLQPESYTVTEYDAQETQLAVHSADSDACPCLRMLYTLQENTKYIYVKFSQVDQGIVEIRAFTEGKLPKTVIKWEKGADKCDLMVFSAHMDDEWLWFGAIIPYYQLVQKKNVQVVYMANCGRYRYGEALNANIAAGMTTYPLFVGLKDEHIKSYEKTIEDWGGTEAFTGILVEIIRKYKPEVILTHGWGGEYGHNQHRAISRSMDAAIEAAADESQYPESAQQYGAWQVKKFYRHSWKEQVIQFDWHVAYEELNGRTGLETATEAMNQNKSQLKYYQVQDGGKYDNSKFGLCYSTVGDDVLHNDLFENISEPLSETAAAEEAEPAKETETVAETEKIEQPEPTEEPKPVETEKQGGFKWWIIPIIAAVAAAGWTAYKKTQRRRRKKKGRHKKH